MPKIGLLSDTHGRTLATRRAVALLVQAGAERLLHLGDVGSPAVLDELVVPAGGHAPDADATPGAAGDGDWAPAILLPVHVVFGNVDGDAAALGRYAACLGLRVDHPVGRLALPGNRELVFLHGDDSRALAAALARGVAYLCHGHTHRAADERRGPTRVLNPGALCRVPVHTVALLDTDSDAVQFLTVPAG